MKKLLAGFLLLFAVYGTSAQKSNKVKLQATYDAIVDAGIEEPEFVMAQSIQETGWLNCKKCCLQYNNIFGFYKKGNKCMRFESEKECIKYYKDWQKKRYPKWKKKHPKGTYYDFLKHIGYAANPTYNKELKVFVTWVNKNLVKLKSD
ncbi:MAG TPA: glucosaminidase domain-containing protein [Chitinophagaceae bacterium]